MTRPACPVCGTEFAQTRDWTRHLQGGPCVITETHRPKMLEMHMKECSTYHGWFNRLDRHTPTCQPPVTDSDDTQDSDTKSVPGAGPVPGAEGCKLLSEERLRWLDGLEWAVVGRCPYSTIETPKGGKVQFKKTQGPVRTLSNKGLDDRAWKLHFWSLRVLFAPTQQRANAMSVTQLVTHRCSALLRGEWAHLWEEAQAQAAPQLGSTSAASEPGQRGEESARQRRIDTRARMFAR